MSPQRAFHQLRVAEVVSETDDACSLVLAVPPELSGEFAYRPGQFLTVRVPHNGAGSVARCYSLSSSPHTGDRPRSPSSGSRTATPPTGWRTRSPPAACWTPCRRPGRSLPRSLDTDLLMFAGGSGITPVMSIVKSALARGQGRIVLIYTNRDERSVIFGGELGRLAAAAGGQLLVLHWLDSLQGPPTAAAMAALARPYAATRPSCAGPIPISPSPGRPSASWACPPSASTPSGSCRWRRTRSRSPGAGGRRGRHPGGDAGR